MHRRIRDRIASNELVLLIHVHMILIPKVTNPMLFGPPSVGGVLLPPLRRLGLPVCRALAGLHRRVFLTGIPLFRDRDQRGINELAPTSLEPLTRQIRLELLEERVRRPRLGPTFHGTARSSSHRGSVDGGQGLRTA